MSNLTLANPEFGVPGCMDISLGADVFSRMVLHGQQFHHSGSPLAIKTTFGWVLAGSVQVVGIQSQQQEDNCCLAISAPDDLLKETLGSRGLQFTAAFPDLKGTYCSNSF